MGIEETIAEIRDPDLLVELEAARGGFLFAQIVAHLHHRQRERNEARAVRGQEEARRAELSRDQRRRDAVRLVIENEPALPENLQHSTSIPFSPCAACPIAIRGRCGNSPAPTGATLSISSPGA